VTKFENEQIEKIYLHYFAFPEIIFGIKKLPGGEVELFQIEPKRQGCKCAIVSKSLKKSGRFEVFSKTMQFHCYFFCF